MQRLILRECCAEGKRIFPPLVIYFGCFPARKKGGLTLVSLRVWSLYSFWTVCRAGSYRPSQPCFSLQHWIAKPSTSNTVNISHTSFASLGYEVVIHNWNAFPLRRKDIHRAVENICNQMGILV